MKKIDLDSVIKELKKKKIPIALTYFAHCNLNFSKCYCESCLDAWGTLNTLSFTAYNLRGLNLSLKKPIQIHHYIKAL